MLHSHQRWSGCRTKSQSPGAVVAPKIVLHLAAMLIPVPARTPPREGRPTTGLHRCPKEGRSHQINSPLPLQNILPGQTDDLETHRDAFFKKDHLEKPFQMFFPHKLLTPCSHHRSSRSNSLCRAASSHCAVMTKHVLLRPLSGHMGAGDHSGTKPCW